MNRRAVLVGALLVAWPLFAQTGTIRIRVTDPTGGSIPRATVSLMDKWDRTVRTLSTNDVGEIFLENLPRGEWYLDVSAPDFYSYRLPFAICDSREQRVQARLQTQEPGPEGVVVYAAAALLDTMQMPYCATLDLPPEPASPSTPRPTKRRSGKSPK